VCDAKKRGRNRRLHTNLKKQNLWVGGKRRPGSSRIVAFSCKKRRKKNNIKSANSILAAGGEYEDEKKRGKKGGPMATVSQQSGPGWMREQQKIQLCLRRARDPGSEDKRQLALTRVTRLRKGLTEPMAKSDIGRNRVRPGKGGKRSSAENGTGGGQSPVGAGVGTTGGKGP